MLIVFSYRFSRGLTAKIIQKVTLGTKTDFSRLSRPVNPGAVIERPSANQKRKKILGADLLFEELRRCLGSILGDITLFSSLFDIPSVTF